MTFGKVYFEIWILESGGKDGIKQSTVKKCDMQCRFQRGNPSGLPASGCCEVKCSCRYGLDIGFCFSIEKLMHERLSERRRHHARHSCHHHEFVISGFPQRGEINPDDNRSDKCKVMFIYCLILCLLVAMSSRCQHKAQKNG